MSTEEQQRQIGKEQADIGKNLFAEVLVAIAGAILVYLVVMVTRVRVLQGLSILAALSAAFAACTKGRAPLEVFSSQQKEKISEKAVYNQADFVFWGAFYEPTSEDVEALRLAWNDHAKAFPESKSLAELEKELRRSGSRTILVSLFASDYETADLNNKALGWSVYPVPQSLKELPEGDLVLRTLFPVKNPWARYFMLRYSAPLWNETTQMVIGNRSKSIELPRRR